MNKLELKIRKTIGYLIINTLAVLLIAVSYFEARIRLNYKYQYVFLLYIGLIFFIYSFLKIVSLWRKK